MERKRYGVLLLLRSHAMTTCATHSPIRRRRSAPAIGDPPWTFRGPQNNGRQMQVLPWLGSHDKVTSSSSMRTVNGRLRGQRRGRERTLVQYGVFLPTRVGPPQDAVNCTPTAQEVILRQLAQLYRPNSGTYLYRPLEIRQLP
jgi:hypothetical protein